MVLRFLIVPLLLLSACATGTKEQFTTPKEDYEKAKAMLQNGDYERALLFLQSFAASHPYSQYTIQAELLRAYAAYKNKEYILSETLSEEFVRRHPRHPDVAYAKYLLAMSHYKQISPPERDPQQTHAAVKAFKRLIKEHPSSPYARDGAKRLHRLYELLAEHEINVGRFYFEKKKYVAAANRFQKVIEDYQTTKAAEEALYRLAACYAALGLKQDARTIARILQYNYPNGSWSRKAARFR